MKYKIHNIQKIEKNEFFSPIEYNHIVSPRFEAQFIFMEF